MKVLRSLLICLLLISACTAKEKEDATVDLQRRADNAKGIDCVRLSMQVARQSLEAADRSFVAGEAKAAHENVDVTVRYVKRSVDCSLQLRKGEKDAEIELRELIRRANDVQKTLDTDDRPHLAQSVAELEKERDRLLGGMFGSAAGGPAEKKP
jgi:ribosome recycling factor